MEQLVQRFGSLSQQGKRPTADEPSAAAAAAEPAERGAPKEGETTPPEWKPDDWSETAWWKGTWHTFPGTDWKSAPGYSDTSEKDPYMGHLQVPEFNGHKEQFNQYRYTVLNLRAQCTQRAWKFVAPMMIAKFMGSLKDDCQNVELDSTKYRTDTGVEDLLDYLKKRLNITDLQVEREAFEQYFYKMRRAKGDPQVSKR